MDTVKQKHSLKFRMLFLYISSILLPLLLLLSLLMIYLNHLVAKNTRTAYSNMLYSIADNFDTNMASLSDFSMIWLSNDTYSDFFLQANASPSETASKDLNFIQLMEDYQISLQKIMITSFPGTATVSFFPAQYRDTCYHVAKNESMTVTQDPEIPQQDWFQQAILRNGQPVFFYSDTQKQLSLARLITDLNTRKAIGILKVTSFTDIPSLLSGFQADDNYDLYLLDEKQRLLFHTGTHPWDPEDINGLISSGPFQYVNWSLFCRFPSVSLMSESFFLLFYGFIIVLGVFGLSWIFKQMTKGLDHLIKNEYQAKIAQKNAEYQALQSQINPHFLYNALNGIMTLNRIGETKMVEESILRLTGLFRYACGNHPDSTLQDECTFLENYLLIQKMRFDERLIFTIHLEPDLADIHVPKLLLQPLVENAVVHGLSPLDRPMHLSVRISRQYDGSGQQCVIDIIDDGAGFDPDSLVSVQGIGLSNVRERFSAFFDDSSFAIQSQPGGGTFCHITFAVPPRLLKNV